MRRDEILEYPYRGTITHVVAGVGREPDTEVLVYDGPMDEHLRSDEEGKTLQTSAYIISMPLTKNEDNEWIVPRKGDKISVDIYGMSLDLTVDNAEPSQLGGVTVYASRNSW